MKIEKSEVEYFFQNLENGDILETDGKMYMIVKKNSRGLFTFRFNPPTS
jgi:hypothetical protein